MNPRSPRGLLLALLALALPLVPPQPLRAQEEPRSTRTEEPRLEGSDLEIAASLLSRVEARWWRRKGLEDAGSNAQAGEAGRELVQFLRDEGISRLQPMGAAAVQRGRRHLERGELSRAVQDFRFAREIDPLQASAWWGDALARAEKGQWLDAARFGVRGVQLRFSSFWTVYATSVNLAAALWAALILAGALALVALLVRHGPVLVREVDARLPARWHPAWRRTIGWGLLLTPLAVVFIGVWSLFLWAMALVPACRRSERRLIYLWLLLIALTPPVVGALRLFAAVAGSPTAQTAVASVESSLRPDLLVQLATLSQSHPEEATWKVLLARLLAPRYPNRAVPLLREAAELDPRDARIRVALGNVLYRVGKYEAAGVHYREALEIDPDSALALFNQWKVKLALFEFDTANESLLRARRLDARLIDRLEESTGDEEVADPAFTVREVAQQVVADELRPGLRRVLRPESPITLAALGALLGAWVLRIRSGGLQIQRCRSCGKAASLRAGEMGPEGVCVACNQLFSRREGLAPAAREEQLRRIDAHLRRTGRGRGLTQLLLPGTALIHEGRAWLGWTCSVIWVGLLLLALWPSGLLPLPAEGVLWREGLVPAALALIFWLACQLPGLRPGHADQRGGR